MPNFNGALHWVGFKPQALSGVAEDAVTTFLVTEGLNMDPNPKTIARKSFAGTGVNLPPRAGPIAPTGKCPAEVYASTPHPWYWALGHVVSVLVEAGVYLHTITDDALAGGEQNDGQPVNLTAEGFRVFGYSKQPDVRIGKIKLTVTPDEIAHLEIEWVALNQAESDETTSVPVFPTDVLTCRSVSIKIDGAADQTVSSCDVEWNGNVKAENTLNGAGTGAPYVARRDTAPDIKGSIKWIDHPTAEAAKFLAAQSFALVIDLDGEVISGDYSNFLRITLPACQYEGGLAPAMSEKVITGDATFGAYYDVVTGNQILVEAQNSIASLTA